MIYDQCRKVPTEEEKITVVGREVCLQYPKLTHVDQGIAAGAPLYCPRGTVK
jgi:hypothetical protein